MVKKALLGQLSDSDIRLLHVYKAVADCGGFSAAELELNISRSTISRHIQDLELRFGVTLCRRGRGGFALTPEGRQIYQATQRLLASLNEFRSEVNDVHKHLTGTLNLAFFDKIVSNPQAAIATAIQTFDKIAPDVRIEVFIAPLNEIERGVMDGRYHLGVIPIHRPSSSLVYHPLFSEQMHLFCGAAHPLFATASKNITKTDVTACKYAGLGYHSPNMEAGHKLQLQRSATAYDQEAVAHLILSGRYIGYLPDHYAEQFVNNKSMRALLPQLFQYRCEFNAITRQSPKPLRVTQTFLQALIKSHENKL